MKKNVNFKGIIAIRALIIIELFLLIITGCATNVPIKSVRAPTIDTSNVQRLAIRPFENKSGVYGSTGAQIIQYLNDRTSEQIINSGSFTIVSASDPNADGIFTGEIRNLASRDSQEQRERKDKDGNVIRETIYKREVSLEFQYSIISTRTGMPLGTRSRSGTDSATYINDPSKLPDTLSLARSIVDGQLRSFRQDIIPTIVTSNRKLMDETSKDKVVKQQMKVARDLVKSNNYIEAIQLYDEISNEFNSVAARTNAGILRLAIESDRNAQSQLADLNRARGAGMTGAAIDGVISTLNSKLPSGSNIIIMKTSSTDSNRLDNAVDQITKNVVQAGKFKVVDRMNQALINAEQDYQLSGNVSDNTIVSIGQQLGAQYMLLCWIGGSMSSRKLNIRILDVETGGIIDQKDFEI